MSINFTLLSSKVSKRIFFLFVVAALVPILITGLLSYKYVSSLLNSQKQEYLNAASKSYGMSIYDRLLVAEEQYKVLVNTIINENTSSIVESNKTRLVLDYKTELFSDTEIYQKPTNISNSEFKHLQNGHSKLSITHSVHGFDVYLVRLINIDNSAKLISSKLDSKFIFGDPETFSGNEDVCIHVNNKGKLYCSDHNLSKVDSLSDGLNVINETNYLVSTWELFLKARFNTESWNIHYSSSSNFLLGPFQAFTKIFIPALILAVLLVSLISVNQISRILTPLQKLSEQTKNIAKGDFRTKVNLDTDDEFQALGESLNFMSNELEKQFLDVRAMSKLDRAIITSKDHKTSFYPIFEHLSSSFEVHFAGIIAMDAQYNEMGYLYDYDQNAKKINVISSIKISKKDEQLLFQDTGTYFTLLDSKQLTSIPWIEKVNSKMVSLVPLRENDKLMGVIVCGFNKFPDFKKPDLLRLEKFADRVAVALSAHKREEKLTYQANYDNLTGLPNRQHLIERFNQAIETAEFENNHVAFLFIDLDRFKIINDSHGHSTGDKLLTAAADRIRSIVHNTDIVARYGGDEFAAIINNINEPRDVERVAKRIISRLSEVFYIDSYEQVIGASIGISVYPKDGDNWEELLQKADIAMYKAKQKSGGTHLFFTDKMHEDIREKSEIESDLYHAQPNNELYLVYQPQINIHTGAISGAETLIRWRHPTKGEIRPDRFIGCAEENGLIFPIGSWVIRETLQQCEKWQIEHNTIPKISINISPKQLKHENFMSEVEEFISDYDIGITTIEFEITESLFIDNDPHILKILHRLNKLGISIAIDDFGKGYSSLSYLKNLPIQTLKIDQFFINDLKRNDNSIAIVKAIIAMGHALDKTVIAEGIESTEQLEILRELGCDRAQGFLISRPKIAEEVFDFNQSSIIYLGKFREGLKSVS